MPAAKESAKKAVKLPVNAQADRVSPRGSDAAATRTADDALSQRVADVLEEVRPAVQDDGGDVELIEVTDDGTVRVRFHGACVGCPSASLTLKHGIERVLRDKVEAVTRVESVE